MSDKNIKLKEKTENVTKAEPVAENRKIFIPEVDICEDDEKFIILANMPGVSKENINIDFEKDELKIYGKIDNRNDEYEPILSEYNLGDYSRVFKIADGIDSEKINATIKNGLLQIELPKRAKAQKRKIEIK